MDTQKASVVQPVQGEVKIGFDQIGNPTPQWVRKIVRALTWITGAWAYACMFVDLEDFGVSQSLKLLIITRMAAITSLVSVLSRLVGVEPPNYYQGGMYKR